MPAHGDCRFCGTDCLVPRRLPRDARAFPGQLVHLATCADGAAYDLSVTGYDHTTAWDPRTGLPQASRDLPAPVSEGQEVACPACGGTGRMSGTDEDPADQPYSSCLGAGTVPAQTLTAGWEPDPDADHDEGLR